MTVGRYRRIRTRLWLDPQFAGLTDGEKVVALYVLSGPSTNAVGLFRLSPSAGAEDLGTTVETFRRRFAAVLRVFRWRYDAATRVVWVPEWLSENAPHNPNVVKSLRAAFDEIPDGPLKAEALVATVAFLATKGEPFSKAFGKPPGEPSGNSSPNDPVPAPESETVRRFGRTAAEETQHRGMVDRVRQVREQKAAGIEQAEQSSRRRDAS